jgi:hypothetical protein
MQRQRERDKHGEVNMLAAANFVANAPKSTENSGFYLYYEVVFFCKLHVADG